MCLCHLYCLCIMGFLIIDPSLPLYKLLINVKRMNHACVFCFKSNPGYIENRLPEWLLLCLFFFLRFPDGLCFSLSLWVCSGGSVAEQEESVAGSSENDFSWEVSNSESVPGSSFSFAISFNSAWWASLQGADWVLPGSTSVLLSWISGSCASL